jgi:hypothetical protein
MSPPSYESTPFVLEYNHFLTGKTSGHADNNVLKEGRAESRGGNCVQGQTSECADCDENWFPSGTINVGQRRPRATARWRFTTNPTEFADSQQPVRHPP